MVEGDKTNGVTVKVVLLIAKIAMKVVSVVGKTDLLGRGGGVAFWGRDPLMTYSL